MKNPLEVALIFKDGTSISIKIFGRINLNHHQLKTFLSDTAKTWIPKQNQSDLLSIKLKKMKVNFILAN